MDLDIVRGQTAPFPTSSKELEPSPGEPYADFLRTWTDDHVAYWLADTKCSALAAVFRANDIRGDILLDLDQVVLKEMGVSNIGDRLRILNAVKTLRQRVASRSVASPGARVLFDEDASLSSASPSLARAHSRRLDAGRPAPLQLSDNSSAPSGLPHLVREQGPDSARHHNFPRPLPSINTPTSATSMSRQIPKGQPPPSGRLPPRPSQPSTPSSANWTGSYHLPSDPRPKPSNSPMTARTPSRGAAPMNSVSTSHTRQPSRPLHPFAASPLPQHNLSPIVEVFGTPSSASYAVGKGPFSPPTPGTATSLNVPSLDTLRRKHVKFFLPDGMQSSSVTIDVSSCADGVEVLEKVLKKVGKLLHHSETIVTRTSSGGLIVNGWSIVLDYADPNQGQPITRSSYCRILSHKQPSHFRRGRSCQSVWLHQTIQREFVA